MIGDAARPRPLLLGYVNLPVDARVAELGVRQRRLAEFAEAEGFALVEVFADLNPNRPLSAFAAVITAAKVIEVDAVAVSKSEDLGRLPFVRSMMRQRLQRESGARVLIVPPGSVVVRDPVLGAAPVPVLIGGGGSW